MANIRGLNDLEGGRGNNAQYGRVPGGASRGMMGDGPQDPESQEAASLFGGLTGGGVQDVAPR